MLKSHLLLFRLPQQHSELGFSTYEQLPPIRACRLQSVIETKEGNDWDRWACTGSDLWSKSTAFKMLWQNKTEFCFVRIFSVFKVAFLRFVPLKVGFKVWCSLLSSITYSLIVLDWRRKEKRCWTEAGNEDLPGEDKWLWLRAEQKIYLVLR